MGISNRATGSEKNPTILQKACNDLARVLPLESTAWWFARQTGEDLRLFCDLPQLILLDGRKLVKRQTGSTGGYM